MRLDPILALLASASLAACGGGGGDPDVADKYVGTWTNSCSVSGANSSYNGLLVYTKTGATSTRFTFNINFYSTSTNCTGNFSADIVQGTDAYRGTKTIGGDVVDLIETTINKADGSPDGSYKDIGLVAGNRLYFGDSTKPVDPNGYPTTLDRTFLLTKQ